MNKLPSSDPKAIAADIARELREHPERWTTGWCARDESGGGTSYDDDDAVCWCLMGHIMRRAPEADVYVIGAPFFAPFGLDPQADDIGFYHINDDKTVEQIIELCEKVANG